MRIYYFQNVRYGMNGWWSIFGEIVNHLLINHAAEIRHKANHRCEGGTTFYIEEFDYHMKDCEMFIYDENKDSLKIISFSEFYTEAWKILTTRNNKNDMLLVPQLYDWFNKDIITGKDTMDFSQYNFKISSTVFYTLLDEINYEDLYKRRKQKDFSSLEDKMFMMFTTLREDPFKLSELGYLNKDLTPVNNFEYFERLINYKIGLSIATVAEHCYRDIEYMAVGVPFIRIEYMRHFDPPLIPNHHYIAIDREKYKFPYNNQLNRIGGEEYINAYIERFLEVKDDKDFLEFVSNNAREYYLKYCGPQNRLKHILKLLDIDPELKLVY